MTPAQLAGAAAIAVAQSHADPAWLAAADRAVRGCAAVFHDFTSDDIWHSLVLSDVTTHEHRAMGAVIRKAIADGIIVPTGGYRPSVRTQCHGRPVRIYRRATK